MAMTQRLQPGDISALGAAPEGLLKLSPTELYSLPIDQVEAIRLLALKARFATLSPRIAVLKKLSEAQGIASINSIDDGAVLLFPHSLYKSYPLSAIERSDFGRITRWLATLTIHDLSKIDASACETIDEWVDLLDRESEIHISHSSGTTGKLSFLPRSEIEMQRKMEDWRWAYVGFGDEPNNDFKGLADVPSILLSYRTGGMGQARRLAGMVRYVYGGDESMAVALHPGRMSADVLALAGLMKGAESKGPLARGKISPKLLARRDEFLKQQADAPARMQEFLTEISQRFRGRRVEVTGSWPQHYDVAVEGLRRGISGLFSPDSLVTVSGGTKGRVLPDNCADVIREFLGVQELRQSYGMSEAVATYPSCPHGKYHIQPTVIPYLLDPATGVPFPRTGTHTGRYGVFDLLIETYWGGFLTSDEVTLSWGDTEPCPCGRAGAYLHQNVGRYSEQEGGDDKITCAGAPDAHDKALTYLANLE